MNPKKHMTKNEDEFGMLLCLTINIRITEILIISNYRAHRDIFNMKFGL